MVVAAILGLLAILVFIFIGSIIVAIVKIVIVNPARVAFAHPVAAVLIILGIVAVTAANQRAVRELPKS